MSPAPLGATPLNARLLTASHGPAMLAINEACPIVADLTFVFDRGTDFFGWPSLVYDRFWYAGVFAGDRLVGYCLVGLVQVWTGRGHDWLAVLGDARMLPEYRGAGGMTKALELLAGMVPGEVGQGVFIIKEGNRAADRLRGRVRLDGYEVYRAGTLTVQNLFLLRRLRPVVGVDVTTASPDDLPAILEVLRQTWRGRPFAPATDAGSLTRWIERPGLGWQRTYVARRRGRPVGVVGAWDMGAFHATRVVRYSPTAELARGLHAAFRLILRDAAPLPAPGDAFRSLTITLSGTPSGDPDVLRALLVAVNNDHLDQAFHLLHVGVTAPGGERPLRSWYRQRFRSTIHTISRAGVPPPVSKPGAEPCLDLSLI